MKRQITIVALVSVLFAAVLSAKDIATLRNGTDIAEQDKSDIIYKPITDDKKVSRNYPMQPPLIPHNIRDYQVDLNVNTCMACHSRNKISETQATMVSVTHYMDRDGNFLAEISPRRYFCNQCHVVQHDARPLVENEFIDMHKLISQKQKASE